MPADIGIGKGASRPKIMAMIMCTIAKVGAETLYPFGDLDLVIIPQFILFSLTASAFSQPPQVGSTYSVP
jgi:hypothetical protein